MALLKGLDGAAPLLGLLLVLTGACSGGATPHENQAGSAGMYGESPAGSAGRGGSAQAGAAAGGSTQGGGLAGGSEQGGGHAGGAGGATKFDPTDLQLNDVSVLFPLPKTEQEQLLPMTAKGARGLLLPEKVYDGVGHILGSFNPNPGSIGGDYEAPYANLRVVALRVDPCFAALAPAQNGGDCQNQLRLVVQEIDAMGAFDSALHLFYAISRDELLELVAGIAGLRQTLAPGARMGKLQRHPVMAAEGLAGAMASGVRSAVLAHAGEQNLVRITRMSAQGGPFWHFSGFDLAAGELTPMHIPTLPSGDDVSQRLDRGFGGLEKVHPTAVPVSGSEDDFMVLLDFQAAQALSKAEQQAKFASLLRVENPGHHSPNTLDCVSCHAATPATRLVVEPTLGLSSAGSTPRFLPDPKLISEAELEATFDDQEPLTNVHAFSYTRMGGVGINQRAVNESAAVVEYLSKQTFPGQR
ncbi:MAG TPA: hypothetical protein VIW29_21130 [Polyangiaceae bacterium]